MKQYIFRSTCNYPSHPSREEGSEAKKDSQMQKREYRVDGKRWE